MKKQLSALLLTTCSMFAFNASANTAGDLCYPLAHGENGQGSTNFKHLPHTISNNTDWFTHIYMTNTSDKPLNIQLFYKTDMGVSVTPNNVDLYGPFNASNTPINDWAILGVGQSARISVRDDGAPDYLAGEIHWQADSCLEEALVVTVRNVYNKSGSYSQGLVAINSGNPF